MNNPISFKDLNTQIVSGLIVLFVGGLIVWFTGFFKRRRIKRNEKLISHKFERFRVEVEGEFQNKLRKKQEELAKTGVPHSGYGQEQIRNIQIKKIKKLAEESAAIDKEVYGNPTKETDKNRILDRVKSLVDDHIESLIRKETEKKEGPRIFLQKVTEQIKSSGDGIISNIKSNLLISMEEARLGPRERINKFICIIKRNFNMSNPLVYILVALIIGFLYYVFKFKQP